MVNASETKPCSTLEELVGQYHIVLQVWPQYSFLGCQRVQIGFELELIGSHSSDPNHLNPTCTKCVGVRAALRRIAGHIILHGSCGDDARYTFELFDHPTSILCSPRYGNRPAVNVSINVEFRSGSLPREDRLLSQLKRQLSVLGIHER